MEEEDRKNKELLIVGQAFFNTGIREVENIIQEYIEHSELYHDSYTVALLNKIKDEIELYRENQNENDLRTREPSIYYYSGKLIKVYDKEQRYGYCVKKDYINDSLVEIQGICLDFDNSQIIELNEKEAKLVDEVYCEKDNKLYQLEIKTFTNKDYGKVLYDDIKDHFLVLKKEEVLER